MVTTIPICPDCGIEGKSFVTSPAALYGIPIEDVLENPYLAMPRATGEWYCPKCKKPLPPPEIIAEEGEK